jgi:D-tyrosyl-tRNA(Tyr) deacylase
MRSCIQRVRQAAVAVDGVEVGAVGPGLLALVGVQRGDGPAQADRLAERIVRLRVFADATGKMNLDLGATGGGLLVVSQFTLCADLAGNRPSFTPAAPPDEARPLIDRLVARCTALLDRPVATGRFGADMQVALVNDGPVTIWIDLPPG